MTGDDAATCHQTSGSAIGLRCATADSSDDQLDVLVVEDNPGDVHLITEALETADFESAYSIVTDGSETLDHLSQRAQSGSKPGPDLVLLDLNIPKLTGRDVIEAIRSRQKTDSIPIVVLSGSEAPDDIRETRELGANGYFVKPVDPNEFISLVRSIGRSVTATERVPSGEHADIDSTA